MSKITAVVLLVVYGLILFVLSYILNKKDKSFKSFMVANRKVGVLVASFSIAATWIWAPALFVSAQKAFQQGLVGFGYV